MSDKEQAPQGAIDAGDVITAATKLTKWKTYVLYAALAVILVQTGVILWQRGSVAKAETALAQNQTEMLQLKTERDIAKTNENSCKLALDTQSGKVGDAGKEYDKLQRDFNAYKKEIEDGFKSGKYYKKADDIRNQPTPKDCDGLLDFFNKNI